MSSAQVRNLMSLALCQAEGGKPDEAPKTLQRAYEMAEAAKLTVIQQEVAILQVCVCGYVGGCGGGRVVMGR
jgi:hypothetical protein